MKNKLIKNQMDAGKEAVACGVLPLWATAILAQHYRATALMSYYCHSHRCAGCDQIMICHCRECRNFEIYCPTCHAPEAK